MGGSMLLKIASRKSDLARLQAYIVAEALQAVDNSIEVEHLFSASFGDMNPDIPLDQMPSKGAFTEDFKNGIANGEFDLVVHSWKDLPTDLPATSQLFTLKREDPRDLLIVRKDCVEKDSLKILTSSPRRIHHIAPFLKEFYPRELKSIECPEVRGNIPTRLEKLIRGDGDALIMAKAALDRLLSATKPEFDPVVKDIRDNLSQCHFMVLPLSHFPTAAAQGALAIEVNKENAQVIEVLKKVHCSKTFENVKRERNLLRSYGGGCHQKLGMTSVPHEHGDYFSVSGISPQGEEIKNVELINSRTKETVDENCLFQSQNFFTRNSLEAEIPQADLYVPRDHALPSNYVQRESLLFTSGTSTWKKLAKRGYWVCGTSESLGENWGRDIDRLLGREIHWTKLSHKDAPGEKISTYELVPKDELPEMANKTHFYWMSGSQFNLALDKNPDLKTAHHACGPGSTHSIISKVIPTERLEIYLSYEEWYQSKRG